MVQRIAFILVLLSLASLASVGPTPLVERASGQRIRSGPPPQGSDSSQREDRRGRSRGDRRPDDGSGRRGPRGDSPGDENGDRGTSRSTSASSSSAASSSSSGSSQPSSGGGGLDLRGYARRLVAQHDKDGDMMLEGDERAELRGEAAKSDLNNDGKITVDELVMHLSAPGAGGSAASSRSEGASGDQPATDRAAPSGRDSRSASSRVVHAEKITNGERKSYRFRSPKERLPEGLPGFFSRDANGDGQVSMSEYSRRWSDRTVVEFRRYDRNNDGMITPKECLQQK